MSKDKYRPSISADEVVRRDTPLIVGPDTSAGVVDESPLGGGRGDLPEGPVSRDAPTNLRIVSQKAYYSPEGYQYVEVVVAWDDVPGATEYLIRTAMG